MKGAKSVKLLLFAGVVSLFSGCLAGENSDEPGSRNDDPSPAETLSAEDAKSVTDPANEFGVDLFKQLADESPEENIFISPVSVSMALSMLYNGAEGETKDEIAEVLRLKGMDMQSINSSSEQFIKLMNRKDDAQVNIANSIWTRDTFGLNESFKETLEDFYLAKAESLDFSEESSVEKINSWVAENTEDKIKEIVGERINDSTVLILANAIYFKGQWEDEFNKELTSKTEFNGVQSAEEMDFMERTGDYKYTEEGGAQIIKLPYKEWDMHMLVILPEGSPSEFLEGKSYEDIVSVADDTSMQEGTIRLPKFKLEYENTLNDTLRAMGMESMFNPSADLSGITEDSQPDLDNLFVSQVKHKSFIEVNEEGAEAAASTKVELDLSAMPPNDEFLMEVNRPFLYMIVDRDTESALFMGVVNQLDG